MNDHLVGLVYISPEPLPISTTLRGPWLDQTFNITSYGPRFVPCLMPFSPVYWGHTTLLRIFSQMEMIYRQYV